MLRISPVDQASLAHAAVSQQDHLCQLGGERRPTTRRTLQRRGREPGLLVRRAVPRVGRWKVRYLSRLPGAFLAHGEICDWLLCPHSIQMTNGIEMQVFLLSDAIGGFTSLSPPYLDPPSPPCFCWNSFVYMKVSVDLQEILSQRVREDMSNYSNTTAQRQKNQGKTLSRIFPFPEFRHPRDGVIAA